MKKAMVVLTLLFMALTFIGAFYVISNGGRPNAGYAAVPMVLAIACMQWYKAIKKKEE